MDHKIKWLLALLAILLVASACNLVANLFNPTDRVISEVEEIVEDIDTDQIESEIEALATQLPSQIPDLGEIGDLNDLEATVQAVQESFASGEKPADIPLVDEPVEIIFSSAELLSYTTPLDLEKVLSFYQEEMPAHDWQRVDDGSMIMADAAILEFSKPDRNANITLSINPQDGSTVVMVAITGR